MLFIIEISSHFSNCEYLKVLDIYVIGGGQRFRVSNAALMVIIGKKNILLIICLQPIIILLIF